MKKFKRIYILIGIILIVVASLFSTYAWYVNVKKSSNNFDVSLESNIDNIELIGIYALNDANYDGIHDVSYTVENNIAKPIDPKTKTLKENMDIFYTDLKASNKNFNNITRGAKINYRIILSSKNNTDVDVNIFIPYVEKTTNYQSSIIYKVTSLSTFDILESNYNNIIEVNPENKLVDKNLWDLSNLENMLDENIILKANKYLIIDFTIECFVNDDSYLLSYYNQKMDEYKNVLTSFNVDNTLITNYIDYLNSDINYGILTKEENYNAITNSQISYVKKIIDRMYDLAYSYKYVYENTHKTTDESISLIYNIPGICVKVIGN